MFFGEIVAELLEQVVHSFGAARTDVKRGVRGNGDDIERTICLESSDVADDVRFLIPLMETNDSLRERGDGVPALVKAAAHMGCLSIGEQVIGGTAKSFSSDRPTREGGFHDDSEVISFRRFFEEGGRAEGARFFIGGEEEFPAERRGGGTLLEESERFAENEKPSFHVGHARASEPIG